MNILSTIGVVAVELIVYYLGYHHGKSTIEEDIHNITMKKKD